MTIPDITARLNELREVNRNDLGNFANSNFETLIAALEKACTALSKIAEHETLDGGKYNSYEQGWHGVADFSRASVAEISEILKGSGK